MPLRVFRNMMRRYYGSVERSPWPMVVGYRFNKELKDSAGSQRVCRRCLPSS
jgi:hypothetical protein